MKPKWKYISYLHGHFLQDGMKWDPIHSDRNEMDHFILAGMESAIPFRPEWNDPFHSDRSEQVHSGWNGMDHFILDGME